MNILKKLFVVTVTSASLASVSFSASSANAPMDPYIETALVNVCKSVIKNSPISLKKTVRGYRLKMDTITEKLMCNNETPYQFALTHNADRNARLLKTGSVEIKDIAAVDAVEKYYVYID
ncbi:DUF3718 domain-containing protein [Flocculibacter collagenilyticus]|uniref:DUF3718 domain-containing protein n=1 Tax=Flocculibacter collagenilyticus TaxID=2744479 RepID=UPI0018F348AF|nr:DUF3718 domain-containing protein [Flocculibacter collagenilyticus]